VEQVRKTDDGYKVFYDTSALAPWFRGFKGTVQIFRTAQGVPSYRTIGCMASEDPNYTVTELPIGVSIQDFIDKLNSLVDTSVINDYVDKCTVNKKTAKKEIKFVIVTRASVTLSTFGLVKNNSISNMVLFIPIFDSEGEIVDEKIKCFTKIEDIINEYCKLRLFFYQKRKLARLHNLKKMLVICQNKLRFIKELSFYEKYECEHLMIEKMSANKQREVLTNKGYYNDNDDYKYLLGMSFSSMSEESIEHLLKKEKECREELEAYLSKSSMNIWLDELQELETYLLKTGDYKIS
jgi:DNA topoisomerase-2